MEVRGHNQRVRIARRYGRGVLGSTENLPLVAQERELAAGSRRFSARHQIKSLSKALIAEALLSRETLEACHADETLQLAHVSAFDHRVQRPCDPPEPLLEIHGPFDVDLALP